jgi:hypothetical protein
MFERQTADGVDDFVTALAGGDHDPVAGDLNYLARVGKSDAAHGGQHLERAGFDAANPTLQLLSFRRASTSERSTSEL